jgi:hypothetical protein
MNDIRALQLMEHGYPIGLVVCAQVDDSVPARYHRLPPQNCIFHVKSKMVGVLESHQDRLAVNWPSFKMVVPHKGYRKLKNFTWGSDFFLVDFR